MILRFARAFTRRKGASPSNLYPDAATALDGILRDGIAIACSGYGRDTSPECLLDAVFTSRVERLTVISNSLDLRHDRLGDLLSAGRVRKLISTDPCVLEQLERLAIGPNVEIEFCPEPTLLECLRAGRAGITRFYTTTGVGAPAALGKRTITLAGEEYVEETAITPDLTLVKAWKADGSGTVAFRELSNDFTHQSDTCGKLCLIEAEEIVPEGSLPSESVHLSADSVHRLILSAPSAANPALFAKEEETA